MSIARLMQHGSPVADSLTSVMGYVTRSASIACTIFARSSTNLAPHSNARANLSLSTERRVTRCHVISRVTAVWRCNGRCLSVHRRTCHVANSGNMHSLTCESSAALLYRAAVSTFAQDWRAILRGSQKTQRLVSQPGHWIKILRCSNWSRIVRVQVEMLQRWISKSVALQPLTSASSRMT